MSGWDDVGDVVGILVTIVVFVILIPAAIIVAPKILEALEQWQPWPAP